MKFAIRVLTQYGDNPQEVYDRLAMKFYRVEVHEELIPYKHYHCQVEAPGLCLKQVKKKMYNIPKLNKLPRKKDNLYVDQVYNDKDYEIYMRKQNGRCVHWTDFQEGITDADFLHYEKEAQELINIGCQFDD